LGSIGYVIYSAAFWVYDREQVSSFVIISGAILGCLAAIFWSAQGAIMMSYPEEKDKGKFVAIFWSLFNFGGILGSLIALVLNLKNTTGGVSTGTYIAFVAIMLVGVVFSLVLANPSNVVRSDGTCITIKKASHWRDELAGVFGVWKEWKMLALIPAFLASNWFYAYQFRINSIYFDPSTRALNGLLYWGLQVLGSLSVGYLLDFQGFSRRSRGLITLGILFLITNIIWAGGFTFQLTFNNDYSDPIHWDHPRFGGPFILFLMYGFADSIYQTYLYWLMGAMSNDPALLARYAGFYKAMQSAGAAVAFCIDASPIHLLWECLICWILVFVSFPLIFLVTNKIKDTSIEDNNLSKADISNETIPESLETIDEKKIVLI
jgi:hypothetical protein